MNAGCMVKAGMGVPGIEPVQKIKLVFMTACCLPTGLFRPDDERSRGKNWFYKYRLAVNNIMARFAIVKVSYNEFPF